MVGEQSWHLSQGQGFVFFLSSPFACQFIFSSRGNDGPPLTVKCFWLTPDPCPLSDVLSTERVNLLGAGIFDNGAGERVLFVCFPGVAG